jgi:hypothetical protein
VQNNVDRFLVHRGGREVVLSLSESWARDFSGLKSSLSAIVTRKDRTGQRIVEAEGIGWDWASKGVRINHAKLEDMRDGRLLRL